MKHIKTIVNKGNPNAIMVSTADTPDRGLETMVFPMKGKNVQWDNPIHMHTKRHCSEDDAKRFHQNTVDQIDMMLNGGM